jgi:DNA-binding FadR family transcriptional regulator
MTSPAEGSKLGAAIATAIEDDVVARGWPVGDLLGSEADLLGRYGASRAVLREAIRIVEHAGVARMRRGPGGGLFVTAPDRRSVAAAASMWFSYVGVTTKELRDAYEPLRSSDLAGNPAITLFAEVLELILRRDHDAEPRGDAPMSERLAATMREDIERAGWRVGQVIGSEPELLERYGASRVAFREAVRLLEHHKAARMRRGPGGGLFVAAPDASSVVRAAELVLAFSKVQTRQLLQARSALELAAVRLAAERCDDQAAATLRAALAAEHAAEGRRKLRAAFHEVHRALARACGSRPISLFVDVLTDLTERDPTTHQVYRREEEERVKTSVRHAHESIVDAVTRGDAALAQRRMLRHLEVLLHD